MIVLGSRYSISANYSIFVTAKVTLSDPTDPTVSLEKRELVTPTGAFKASEYNFYCDIC